MIWYDGYPAPQPTTLAKILGVTLFLAAMGTAWFVLRPSEPEAPAVQPTLERARTMDASVYSARLAGDVGDQDMPQNENGRLAVTLRLPRELIDRIDRIRESQAITIPRNTWIAEAVARRVENEGRESEDSNATK